MLPSPRNRPHVGLLFEFPTLNGGEHSMLSVLRQLQKGMLWTAFAPPEGPLADQLHSMDIPVVPYCVRDGAGKRDIHTLQAELRARVVAAGIDILHSNSLAMARLSGQLTDLPASIVRTGHLRDIMRLSKSAVRDLNNNQRLVAVSHATRVFHVQQGLDAERCEVIYNGVDTHRFRPGPRLPELLPGLPDDARLILNVGQICLRKDQLTLARAVCQLLRTRDDLHLMLAGKRHSGKQESEDHERAIEAEFQSAGRRGHLHLPGYCDDVATLMNQADLLVHSARQEPFGRTLLEAASAGLPIIATAVGGTQEMLRTNIDAVLIEPDDPTLLGHAMAAALDHPAESHQRATSARERMRAEFDVKLAAQKMGEFWQRQAGGAAASA